MTTVAAAVDVSIVVPLKDERDSIAVLASEIEAAMESTSYGWECIWVDDGSTDDSLEVLQALFRRDPRHRFVSLARNVGQSGALAVGFRAARGTVLATLDSDLQNDPADLPRLLAALQSSEAGMVTGVRAERHDSWVRKLSSRIGNGFRNWVTGDHITDVGCSLRVFHARYAENLPVFRGMHRFLPTLLKMEGCRFVELPVNHRPRRYGDSKYGIGNRLWVGLQDSLAVRWMLSRQLHPQVALTSERMEGEPSAPERAAH